MSDGVKKKEVDPEAENAKWLAMIDVIRAKAAKGSAFHARLLRGIKQVQAKHDIRLPDDSDAEE